MYTIRIIIESYLDMYEFFQNSEKNKERYGFPQNLF